MLIKKGTKVKVEHARKGKFIAIAKKNFDTDKEQFYPVVLAEGEAVEGRNDYWEQGEVIPCNKNLCKITVV